MTPTRRVDVVVPCYNYGRFLEQAVCSVLNQGVPVRVLVIDDASTDNSAEVATELARRFPSMDVLHNRSNRGHVATYNIGIEWLESDYFVLLSADDMLCANSLSRSVQALDDNPNATLAFGRATSFSERIPQLESADLSDRYEVLRGSTFIQEVSNCCWNPISSPAAAIVRSAVQKKIGGYLSSLPSSCDLEMWLRFATHGSVIRFDGVLGLYRRHGANMSCHYYAAPIRDLEQRWNTFTTFFGRYGDVVENADALLARAGTIIGEAAFWAAARNVDRGDTRNIQRYLDLALKASPSIRSRTEWRNLAVKRAMGPSVWRRVRPMWEALRGASPQPVTPDGGDAALL